MRKMLDHPIFSFQEFSFLNTLNLTKKLHQHPPIYQYMLLLQVSAELKMARSLVRLAEIQATLQEQRILFLRQQMVDMERHTSPVTIDAVIAASSSSASASSAATSNSSASNNSLSNLANNTPNHTPFSSSNFNLASESAAENHR